LRFPGRPGLERQRPPAHSGIIYCCGPATLANMGFASTGAGGCPVWAQFVKNDFNNYRLSRIGNSVTWGAHDRPSYDPALRGIPTFLAPPMGAAGVLGRVFLCSKAAGVGAKVFDPGHCCGRTASAQHWNGEVVARRTGDWWIGVSTGRG